MHIFITIATSGWLHIATYKYKQILWIWSSIPSIFSIYSIHSIYCINFSSWIPALLAKPYSHWAITLRIWRYRLLSPPMLEERYQLCSVCAKPYSSLPVTSSIWQFRFLISSTLGEGYQLYLTISSKTVSLLTSNLTYPMIQICDPINSRRAISSMTDFI